ncbi:hypothetical protein BDV23DRAFT_177126 [Aspergillus alliaceus]|uniref:Uncharacterized protein n=1 Tax=Petromyces alliaceus TaxID=209559 RepID=A0A5N7BR85_PETAA|nr:hypothetical protein BDV23DRAFT_177126 [Aspergillus alliaceus]
MQRALFTDKEVQLTSKQQLKYQETAKNRCHHLDVENHIPVIVSQNNLTGALRHANVLPHALITNITESLATLQFSVSQVQGLHRQHRAKVSSKVLPPINRCEDLKVSLVKEYANQKTPTDGEIYRKIRQYKGEQNEPFQQQISILHQLITTNYVESSVINTSTHSMKKINQDTVNTLQLLAPSRYCADTKIARGLILSSQMFSDFKRFNRLVLSLYTFFKDFKYLESYAQYIKHLFSPLNESSTFQHQHADSTEHLDLSYRQVWLYTIQNYPLILPDPKSDNDLLAKPNQAKADKRAIYNIAELTSCLRFHSPEIRSLVEGSPDRHIAAVPCQSEVPYKLLADSSVKARAQCGMPQFRTYKQDSPLLFLDYVHDDDAPVANTITTFFIHPMSRVPSPRASSPTSLFVRDIPPVEGLEIVASNGPERERHQREIQHGEAEHNQQRRERQRKEHVVRRARKSQKCRHQTQQPGLGPEEIIKLDHLSKEWTDQEMLDREQLALIPTGANLPEPQPMTADQIDHLPTKHGETAHTRPAGRQEGSREDNELSTLDSIILTNNPAYPSLALGNKSLETTSEILEQASNSEPLREQSYKMRAAQQAGEPINQPRLTGSVEGKANETERNQQDHDYKEQIREEYLAQGFQAHQEQNRLDTELEHERLEQELNLTQQSHRPISEPAEQQDRPDPSADLVNVVATAHILSLAEDIEISFWSFEREQWRQTNCVKVSPSDLSHVEHVARKYMRKKYSLYNQNLQGLSPTQCFRAATINGNNAIFVISEEEEKKLAIQGQLKDRQLLPLVSRVLDPDQGSPKPRTKRQLRMI